MSKSCHHQGEGKRKEINTFNSAGNFYTLFALKAQVFSVGVHGEDIACVRNG